MDESEIWKILTNKKMRVVFEQVNSTECEILIEGWDYERNIKTGEIKRTGIVRRYNQKPCAISKAMSDVRTKIAVYFKNKEKETVVSSNNCKIGQEKKKQVFGKQLLIKFK